MNEGRPPITSPPSHDAVQYPLVSSSTSKKDSTDDPTVINNKYPSANSGSYQNQFAMYPMASNLPCNPNPYPPYNTGTMGLPLPPPAPGGMVTNNYHAGAPIPPPQMAPSMGNGHHQVQWMQKPTVGGVSCPPGLEYLTQVDQLLVHQQIELLEVFTNWETKNKYVIKNSMGQQVYFAAEESDVCSRQCCGPQRSFIMHITDNMGFEAIRVNRAFKCCALPVVCCYCCSKMHCCAQELVVEAPPGNIVGKVRQTSSCLEPHYNILDADGDVVLGIRGPCCICQGPCCTWDQEFLACTTDGTQIGKICKQWSGFVREYFTDADNFGVSFPLDLDVKMKACLLASVFLIDFMFFEDNQQNQNN